MKLTKEETTEKEFVSKLKSILKTWGIVAVLLVLIFVVNFSLGYYKDKKTNSELIKTENEELKKQVGLLKNSNISKKVEGEEYASQTSQPPNTINSQLTPSTPTTEKPQQLVEKSNDNANDDWEEIQEELMDDWEQEQETLAKEREEENERLYEAQLKLDKQSYENAINSLTIDYEYAVKKAESFLRADCEDTSEQSCQIIKRNNAPYEDELEYLEKTYKANLKALSDLKYW